jgi:hypothetical protein
MHQTTYTPTSKIHAELARLGLEIEVNLIEAPQIRRILRALEGVLGENVEWIRLEKLGTELNPHSSTTPWEKAYEAGKVYGMRLYTPLTRAEVLCERWLGGLNPLFDREPETVLTELLEVLEKLRKY